MDEQEQRALRAVELGIIAAGPVGSDARAWRRRVQQAVGDCAAAMREGSDAASAADKILRSSVFKGEFVETEEEYGTTADGAKTDRPTRLIAYFKTDSPDAEDGIEHLRTEPLWTAAGRQMAERLTKELQPGDVVLIYKLAEAFGTGKDAKKARLLTHYEFLYKNARREAPAPAPRQEATVAPEQARSSTAAPARPPKDDNAALTEIARRTEKLPPRIMVQFARACRASGIPDFACPDPGNIPIVLEILSEHEAMAAK